jgi:hypothetical protein
MTGIEGARDQRPGALQEHKRATVIGFVDLRCNARFRQKLGYFPRGVEAPGMLTVLVGH